MMTVEFFFDCSSPWTYLGFHRMVAKAQESGVTVTWRPILVGGVFNAINPSVQHSRDHPVAAKQNYQRKDIADWARHYGLAIKWVPTVFPVNSVKAMRGCFVAEDADRLVPYARAIFEAYWGADKVASAPSRRRRTGSPIASRGSWERSRPLSSCSSMRSAGSRRRSASWQVRQPPAGNGRWRQRPG